MSDNEKKEFFPEASNKTYGLMAIVEGKSPVMDKEPEDTVFTYPNLLLKEIIIYFLLIIALTVISLVFNAPLEELANPSKTPNPAKAPWYFLSLQELLHYFSPFIAGVLIPGAVVGLLVVLPYIDRSQDGIGVWFSEKRKFAITIFTIFIFIVVTFTIIGIYFRGPGWAWVWPWQGTISHH